MLKNKLLITATAGAALLLSLGAALAIQAQSEPQRKIVVFQDDFVNEAAQDQLLSRFGSVLVKKLDKANSKVVLLPPKADKALQVHPAVKRIDPDVIVYALGRTPPAQPSQTTPWGIAKIRAPQANTITTGTAIKVAVIDTGIDLSHPDLKVAGGINTINPLQSANDDNGHGTHVAGTIAALNNTIGVVGVGPDIKLYAVKVLNKNGNGFLSDVIEGIDWAWSNGMQVTNMSLGTTSNIQSFHDAVIRASQAGVTQVAAAGNSGPADNTVNYPARYPETIAVSATDSNDVIASFSSRGPEVDLSAPGVSVYSTYKGSTYATLSGTSMATPHVAASAALVISTPVGLNDVNADGKWNPGEVQTKLQNTAVDLGAPGFDNQYGYGRVDTFAAVSP